MFSELLAASGWLTGYLATVAAVQVILLAVIAAVASRRLPKPPEGTQDVIDPATDRVDSGELPG